VSDERERNAAAASQKLGGISFRVLNAKSLQSNKTKLTYQDVLSAAERKRGKVDENQRLYDLLN
jgi:hypothetical protein